MRAKVWFYKQGQRAKAWGYGPGSGMIVLLGTTISRMPLWARDAFEAGWKDGQDPPKLRMLAALRNPIRPPH
jgi:hypothetical protein